MLHTKARSHRFTLGAFAVGLLMASTGYLATQPQESAIEQFVDCTDSFWAVTCGVASAEPAAEGEVVVRIDNDAVCAEIADDMMICHT